MNPSVGQRILLTVHTSFKSHFLDSFWTEDISPCVHFSSCPDTSAQYNLYNSCELENRTKRGVSSPAKRFADTYVWVSLPRSLLSLVGSWLKSAPSNCQLLCLGMSGCISTLDTNHEPGDSHSGGFIVLLYNHLQPC